MAWMPGARPSARPRPRGRAIRVIAASALLAFGWFFANVLVSAQELTFPPTPQPKLSQRALQQQNAGQKQMLVQADEIDYDYTNHRVAAVGNVQIYYGGSRIEADRVIYDENTKRLQAQGNVRLTEADGTVTRGNVMNLSDDYRNGFVDSLRVETPAQTRMAAAHAERSGGNFTIFHNGVYTACEPCKDDPRKPPEWQVKAVRIIHDQKEKMLYFESARLEFYGYPLVWLPYFSAPDPTVKRKTGFLMPSVGSSTVFGQSIEIPYYWALAPNYDFTFSPQITTKQGVLAQGEFRQRLMNGSYSIRAAGIYQQDKNYFLAQGGVNAPGYRDFRGSVESDGQFNINKKWVWGWDGVVLTDKTFLTDYNPRLSTYHVSDPLAYTTASGVSQLYITGLGNRSYFDARSIYYYGFSSADVQSQLPIIHPVVDYNYTFDHPVFGGELGFRTNLTSLTRDHANFDPITASALASGTCTQTADTAIINSSSCLLRGVPGTYSRFSAEAQWRRTYTDSLGQVFTPFVRVRADAASMSINNEAGVSNYIATGQSNLVRGMPTVGLEYRFPFISVQSWGTQTVEPIVQIIARPDESEIGRFPNEDAQTLVFDDSNLFKVDKFSGWDRAEGGGRANYGVQYTAQFNRAGFFSALFGESYQLFGKNSFAQQTLTNTGIDSGLDTRRSDYVARFSYQPNATYTFSTRFRFDKDTLEAQRAEVEARVNFDRWNFSLLYGDYAPQPELGFADRREGILGTGLLKLNANWVLLGGARYDLKANKIDQNRIGLGYIDDCLILALNYLTTYSYGTGVPVLNHTVLLQVSLRTLGGTSVSQSLTPGTTGAGSFFAPQQ
jgi:LPS-assembly protein